MLSIVSTRFNNDTWKENTEYRERNNLSGCSYGAPYPMSPKIPLTALVFVVEMNNSINKIEGIGLVRNRVSHEKKHRIHYNRNYNRYIYQGKYRISREDIERINTRLVGIIDTVCFKGYTHLKRGIGFTSVSEKILREKCSGLDLKNEIKQVFIQMFGTSSKFIKDNFISVAINEKETNEPTKEGKPTDKESKKIIYKNNIIIVDDF
jgi:hypothetical protein